MLLAPQLLLLGLMALGPPHAATSSAELKLERGSCPMFWFGFNGRCYKYVPSLLPWGQAEQNCASQGANLASIHSQEEHDFVVTVLRNLSADLRPAWIGLNDNHVKGWWSWSDGSVLTYTSWLGDQPSANTMSGCVATDQSTTKWSHYMCINNHLPSVCEMRTVCPQ